MFSPGHSRSSSCSLTVGDGPDFLEITINEPCVDDDTDFMFPLGNEEKFGGDQVDANSNVGAADNESQNLEVKERPRLNKAQSEEDVGDNEEKRYEETRIHSTGGNERTKPSLVTSKQHIPGKGEVLAKNLDKRKSVKGITPPKKGDKLPEVGSHVKKLKAVTKTAAIWKSRTLADGFSVGIDLSQSGNERPSAYKGTRPLLRNLSKSNGDFSKNHKKIGLHDVATKCYAQKKEYRLNSLDNRRKFGLAKRSGARWLKNTIRHGKTELPPIDFSSKGHYSTQWNPKQSISPYSEINILKEHDTFETQRRKEPELKRVLLESVMQTLEKTQLGGKSRGDLVKHSISSPQQNNGRERFKKKAIPVVKTALAFKHPSNKFI